MRHTPPDWRCNAAMTRVLSDEGPICDMVTRTAPELNRPQEWHDERRKANARLISAAPTLLYFLEKVEALNGACLTTEEKAAIRTTILKAKGAGQ